jgi:hypothetical protein
MDSITDSITITNGGTPFIAIFCGSVNATEWFAVYNCGVDQFLFHISIHSWNG